MESRLVCIGLMMATLGALAGERFTSLEQAMKEFRTNSTDVREAAYRYVLKAAENPGEKDAQSVLQALRTMASALGRSEEYESVCMRGMKSDLEPVRYACAYALLVSPFASADRVAKVEMVEAVIYDEHALTLAHRLELVRHDAGVRHGIGDSAAALEILDKALKWPGVDKTAAFVLRARKVNIYDWSGMDDELEREARAILADGECPVQTAVSCLTALSELAVRRNDPKSAGELLLEIVSRGDVAAFGGLAKRMIAARVGAATMNTAVIAIRRRLAGMPFSGASNFRRAVETAQPEIIEMLNHLGRCNEALAECRVLVLTASSPSAYQNAVNLTAVSFKRTDGNLGRATEFMDFQKKGLVPKTRNILMDVPRITDEIRVEAAKALPVGKSECWEESLEVAARLIWLDDPLSSVREAMHAFALAPYDNVSLQACADAMMQPVLTVTRDPDSAKGIVDFLMHGPSGADGRRGTADDVSSPLDDLASVLIPAKED